MNKILLLQAEAHPKWGLGEILVFLAIAFIYFIPAIAGRKKRNAGAIMTLNLFLGWTIIGWVIALVWSQTYEKPL